jgi:hypothetical protein
MKKPVIALFASVGFCLGSAIAIAQPQDQQNSQPNDQQQQGRRHGGARWGDPQQRVNMLAKRLKLSDDQKQKLLPIFTDAQQQMQSLHEDTSMSRDDRMAKMKSIREDTDGKINGILNDDQKQKYAAMQQQMRERMQERSQEHGGNGDAGAAPPQN